MLNDSTDLLFLNKRIFTYLSRSSTYVLIVYDIIFQNFKLLLPHKSKIWNFVLCFALKVDFSKSASRVFMFL